MASPCDLVMNYTEVDCSPEQSMPSVFCYSDYVQIGLPQPMSPINGWWQQSCWYFQWSYILATLINNSFLLGCDSWDFARLPCCHLNIKVGHHHNIVPTFQSWHGQSLWLVMNFTEADCNPEQSMPSVFSYSEAVSHPLGLPQHMSFVTMIIDRLGLVLFSNVFFLSRPLYCSKKISYKDYSFAFYHQVSRSSS